MEVVRSFVHYDLTDLFLLQLGNSFSQVFHLQSTYLKNFVNLFQDFFFFVESQKNFILSSQHKRFRSGLPTYIPKFSQRVYTYLLYVRVLLCRPNILATLVLVEWQKIVVLSLKLETFCYKSSSALQMKTVRRRVVSLCFFSNSIINVGQSI